MRLLIPILLFGILAGCKAKEPTPLKTPDMTDVVSGDAASEVFTFTGTLVQKPWTKSTESYCAQGSEYYVLRTADETIVLEFTTDFDPSYVDKSVTINGYFKEKVIQPDPESQHPVGEGGDGSFTCTVLVVENIALND